MSQQPAAGQVVRGSTTCIRFGFKLAAQRGLPRAHAHTSPHSPGDLHARAAERLEGRPRRDARVRRAASPDPQALRRCATPFRARTRGLRFQEGMHGLKGSTVCRLAFSQAGLGFPNVLLRGMHARRAAGTSRGAHSEEHRGRALVVRHSRWAGRPGQDGCHKESLEKEGEGGGRSEARRRSINVTG